MACIREATAGQGECNGDRRLSIESGRSSQEHEVRQSSEIRQHPTRIPEQSGTKNDEMACNISNADYPGKGTSPRTGELPKQSPSPNLENTRKGFPLSNNVF